jgi:hypothetical protein
VEPLLFIIFIYFFGLLAFGRAGLRWWRNYRRDRWLWKWTSEAVGRPVDEATAGFGPPFEVYTGSSGTLYEWKSPPSETLPPGSGLLILYVVAGADGRITHATWQTRGASV